MINVTLIYPDNTTWFAGGFLSLDEANKWIDEEKKRSYWNDGTTVKIEEITEKQNIFQ